MKIYVAMINDRHSDPEPFLFTKREAAIEYARSEAISNSWDDQIDEQEIAGWLYYAGYGTEGDSVWVLEKNLQI